MVKCLDQSVNSRLCFKKQKHIKSSGGCASLGFQFAFNYCIAGGKGCTTAWSLPLFKFAAICLEDIWAQWAMQANGTSSVANVVIKNKSQCLCSLALRLWLLKKHNIGFLTLQMSTSSPISLSSTELLPPKVMSIISNVLCGNQSNEFCSILSHQPTFAFESLAN